MNELRIDPRTGPRAAIRALTLAPEDALVRDLIDRTGLTPVDRDRIARDAAGLVRRLRGETNPGLMEAFLAEYGLSTEEGLALMCLAEALLRVPDPHTIDALIRDKVGGGSWIGHFGHSGSAMVNASTLGLALTGRLLGRDEADGLLRSAAQRLGKPVIRTAVARAMKEMGTQFVLGQTIEEARDRAAKLEAKGFTHSYDMLGEAAMTGADAQGFLDAYAGAIAALTPACKSEDVGANPGISIKLSALHPRYERAQAERVMAELVPRVTGLARAARKAGMGLNVDAEEADRLDLSLDVIEAVLSDPELAGWDGFGVVVQAYGKRALPVIDWLHGLAERLDRRVMVRLVKGAYWDAEIKRAQVEGLAGFPVFTRKSATDVSYLACARRLLDRADRLYPQFATHNAHSIAAILDMAKTAGLSPEAWEFQRLHGMGDALHRLVRDANGTRCRIYAPVGAHRELLAYLVRRLLENGANSSFVNKVADIRVPPEEVTADPFAAALRPTRDITAPRDLFAPRVNSRGWDLSEPDVLAEIEAARAPFREHRWEAGPIVAGGGEGGAADPVASPADPDDAPGTVRLAEAADVHAAIGAASPWNAPVAERAAALRRASDLCEARHGEIFALLAREAGKTLPDAVAELREAVDFLRYYADEAEAAGGTEPAGIVACISPWNFPLAIFTGQIAAALAAGNAVLAKPAEATPLIAALGVRLMHESGVPATALQLLPGEGRVVGAALASDDRIRGLAFTGSTATAQAINRSMAEALAPDATLIAETGGLNAMVVDSTALPEQVVRDLVASAFQSAGQRCSAARLLYVQEEVADGLLTMLRGAMDELRLGDPWDLSTDVGPIITAEARDGFAGYVAAAEAEGRLLHALDAPGGGAFLGPALVRVEGIEAMEREVFGPVLHVATYPAGGIDAVIDAINGRGYGLTFGLHTRIGTRAERLTARIEAGNAYVNRNQIGAIVGSQPFGGEGLSGTGPKAGGPRYVPRFTIRDRVTRRNLASGRRTDAGRVGEMIRAAEVRPAVLARREMPGPTGEANVLTEHPRGVVLCLGPGAEAADAQAEAARRHGCPAIRVALGATGAGAVDGTLDPAELEGLPEALSVVAWWGDDATATALRRALAVRRGAIVPLALGAGLDECRVERHVCTDTTAAGGNATLIGNAV